MENIQIYAARIPIKRSTVKRNTSGKIDNILDNVYRDGNNPQETPKQENTQIIIIDKTSNTLLILLPTILSLVAIVISILTAIYK